MSDNVINGMFRNESGRKLLEKVLKDNDDLEKVFIITMTKDGRAAIGVNNMDLGFTSFVNVAAQDLNLTVFNMGLANSGK